MASPHPNDAVTILITLVMFFRMPERPAGRGQTTAWQPVGRSPQGHWGMYRLAHAASTSAA